MPSIISATTTNGLSTSADNSGSLQLATNNGTTAVTIDTSQRVLIGATSASGFDSGADNLIVGAGSGSNGITIYSGNTSTAAINFADGTTGSDIYAGGITYNHNTNNLDFSTTDGSGRMRITSAGNLGVGTTSPDSKIRADDTANQTIIAGVNSNASFTAAGIFLQMSRNTTNGTFTAIDYYNAGAGAYKFRVYDSGSILSVGSYNNTTGSGANLFIASDGNISRSTSSLKYKREVEDAKFGLDDVLKLRAVNYKSKSEPDGETVYGGLIAEEVDAAGLTEFVQYADDGTPDALAYGNMVALCVKAIQELNAKVDAQAVRIAELEGAK